jgi:DNA mismatch repair protein MutS2
VDIGDEQSLQQNLSTFSSHLTQIVRILRKADHRTLVLLDELGTGTDPQEGAALGRAIIDFLQKRGALTMATTHLRSLKTYAHIHPRTENASVEFDMETLQPTYRLLIGAFGSSNALAIARRLGVPEDVISKAEELVESEDERVEDLINALQQIKAQLEEEREAASSEREETMDLKQRYESMLRNVEEREKRLKKLPAKEIQTEIQDSEPIQATFETLQRGDTVRIRSLNTVGQVMRKMRDKSKLLVSTNMMKVEVRPEDLEIIDRA